MNLIYKTDLDINTFDNFTKNHPMNSIFQTSNWALTKANWQAHYVGVYDDLNLVGACLILMRQVPLGFKFAYMPRGPIIDYQNQELLNFFFENTIKYLKKHKCIIGKFDPNIIMESIDLEQRDKTSSVKNDELILKFKASKAFHIGYTLSIKDSIQPRIQLGFPILDTWEKDIPRKTRKKINSSHNKGIYTKIVNNTDDLMEMIHHTEDRHNIRLRNNDYFKGMVNAFKDDSCILGGFNPDGKLISALLLVKSKDTCELLYSGYDDEYKHTNSTYPLRHDAILWAKEHGCTKFNFGGVEGTLDDGLMEFKKAFNPKIDAYIGEFNLYTYPIISKIAAKFVK